jgi:hypothetical protein
MKRSSISFLVSPNEFKLLETVVYLEPFLDDILSKVKSQAGGLRLKFDYDDLEDALSALEYHAQYEDYPGRREQLQALAEKIEGYKRLRHYVPTHGLNNSLNPPKEHN